MNLNSRHKFCSGVQHGHLITKATARRGWEEKTACQVHIVKREFMSFKGEDVPNQRTLKHTLTPWDFERVLYRRESTAV